MNAEDHPSLFGLPIVISDEYVEAFKVVFGDFSMYMNVRIMDKRVYLKIKLKSLAQEAKYIRHAERKATGDLRFGLHQHRIFVVRSETRATLLAYGYLNGKSYTELESLKTTKRIDWEKVRSMVKRYGNGEQVEGFEAFMKSATV